jgi:predicted MPP superfamily phosphohydrolase
VDTVPIELRLPRLAPEFDGYRVVQISDIHVDRWMNAERLAEIAALIHRKRPDLVVMTGDFITRNPRRFAPELAVFRTLSPPDGIVTVMGNHDCATDPDLIRRVLHESGGLDISNGIHTIRRGDAALHVAGVDDIVRGNPRLDLVVERLPEDGAAILLVHEPDFADVSAATGRFDLQLSGHSHGGQVIIPFVGPPILPNEARKYPLGLYRVNGMFVYTNRGLGMVSPKIRFNCRPEITVFTLRSGASRLTISTNEPAERLAGAKASTS